MPYIRRDALAARARTAGERVGMAAAASLEQALESLERARRIADGAAQRVAESAAALLRNKANAAVAFVHSARARGRAPVSRDMADIEQLQTLYDLAQALCEARANGDDVESDLIDLGREYHKRQHASPHSRASTHNEHKAKSGRRRGRKATRIRRRESKSRSQTTTEAAGSSTFGNPDCGRTVEPPVELGVLVLPELRHLLPGRLGLEALAASRALQVDHVAFASRALRDLPGAANAIAARSERNSAGVPVTALSFGSLPNGVPEDATLGKCCCAAVRTDASGAGDCGVAMVMGVAEANVLLDTLVLRVPDVREDGSDNALGRCWVTLPPFRVPRAHFGVRVCCCPLLLSARVFMATDTMLISTNRFVPSSTAQLWSREE